MPELLRPGTPVELIASVPGYEAGSRGLVVRTSVIDTSVLVRFADSGHALYISRDDLRIADDQQP